MPKYIALLRGINVSGQKLIKMEDLRGIFTDMGFKNVHSYIQSGNVIFETTRQDTIKLAIKIQKWLFKALGYEVPTIIRTSEELKSIVSDNHFARLKASKNAKTYVAFLSATPTTEQVDFLHTLNSAVDTFHVQGTELYLIIDETKGKSVFTNVFVEKKLKMYATTRNWNTVCKLAEY